MAIRKSAAQKGPIELPEFKRGVVSVYVIGESPIIVHAWSKKARTEMLLKNMGQKVPKFPRSPVRDFLDSIYHLPDGRYGFPASALKRAMVTACTSMNKEISKMAAQQAFFIPGERGVSTTAFTGIDTPIQLVPLYSPEAPYMREDATRLANGVACLAYRAEFWPWAIRVDVQFNRLLVTEPTTLALIDTAGFAVGLGDWRQEKSGISGAFKVASPEERKLIDKWATAKPKAPALPDEKAFVAQALDDLKRYGEAQDEETGASVEAAIAAAAPKSERRPRKETRQ